MATRKKFIEPAEEVEEGGGLYFDELPDANEFIHSGCTLLDQVLGGGWALGRVSNVYGDSATGKTLIGIEACANFAHQFPDGTIYYRERESAFDFEFAAGLGLPTERVDFMGYEDGLDTVEDLFDDLTDCIARAEKTREPCFYCVDSLDSFSDEDEQDNKDIRKVTGIAKKPRLMSQLFRQRIGSIARSRMHLMFISQLRTKIGVTMGRKTERAGGVALRFYASQIIFLRQKETITPEVKGVKRPIGVQVIAKSEKNKKGMPYRDCEFPILFTYGIDDLSACINFLVQVGDAKKLGIDQRKKGDAATYIKETNALRETDYHAQMRDVRRITREVWAHIEDLTRERYLPVRSKYGG